MDQTTRSDTMGGDGMEQERDAQSPAALVAELNDLLQLDHDAIQAYTVAIHRVKNPEYRETITRFRGDHERHIEELTALIRTNGGVPVELPHLPTGVFKLAVQALGAAGGDRALVMAFKANERQGRDKYRRAAAREHPPEIARVLSRAAEDESRHYAWALETLEELGIEPGGTADRMERAFEVTHKGMADVVEGAEKGVMHAAESARRALKNAGPRGAVGIAALAVGIGIVAAQLFGRGRR